MKMRVFKVHIEKETVNCLIKEEFDYQKTFYYNEKRTDEEIIKSIYEKAVEDLDLYDSDKVEITKIR